MLPASFASIPKSTFVRSQAALSLQHCQYSLAPWWARQLEKIDKAAATLYKLAWLQRTAAYTHHPDATKRSWQWQFNGELWHDEYPELLKTWKCPPNKKLTALTKLPEGVLEELISALRNTHYHLRPAIDEVLFHYALHRWLEEKPLEISYPNTQFTPKNHCRWRALIQLSQTSSDTGSYASFFKDCKIEEPLIKSAVHISYGDILFKKGQFGKSFAQYQQAHHTFQGETPATLWYRLAASGSFSQQPDDYLLRATHSDRVKDLKPIFYQSLKNVICDHFASLTLSDSVRVLDKVYSKKQRENEMLRIFGDCQTPQSRKLLIYASKQAKPRSKIKIIQKVIENRLKDSSISGVYHWTKKLALLSLKYPVQANRAFWKLIKEAPRKRVRPLISYYKKYAKWLHTDTLRERLILNRISKTDTMLKKRHHHSSQILNLPLNIQLPKMVWNQKITLDFAEAFEKDASYWVTP